MDFSSKLLAIFLTLVNSKKTCNLGEKYFTSQYFDVTQSISRLEENIISESRVPSWLDCGTSCLVSRFCVAYNYKEKSKEDEINCQLSHSVDHMFEKVSTEDKDWTLYKAAGKRESECKEINECQNGGKMAWDPVKPFKCECLENYEGEFCDEEVSIKSCADIYKSGVRYDGIYTIDPDGRGSFHVFCDMQTDRGGWTVFQRRQDGSVDFYRGWSDYKDGFGDLNGEFWLGLEKIHRLTKSGQNTLRVDLMDFDDNAYAKYGTFSVASESYNYKLNIGNFSGNAGDSLGYHNEMRFSTKDRDHDESSDSCAVLYRGAWWYNTCHNSNLNGLYGGQSSTGISMSWYSWKNDWRSVKKTEMKIRPVEY